MKSIFSKLVTSFSLFLLFSCNTTAHIPVPGEKTVQRNNISNEYYTIADAYFDLGKYDKACTYYKLAMKNKSLYWSSYYKLGKSYVNSKNWEQAEKVFVDLLKRDSENISLKMSLAYISAMNNNLVKSEELYSQMWETNPDNADILSNYINVLIAAGKTEKAKELSIELKEKFKDNKYISEFEKYFSEEQEKRQKEESSDENSSSE